MAKFTIEVDVTTKNSDPKVWQEKEDYLFWTVTITVRNGTDIATIIERDYLKSAFDKADAAKDLVYNFVGIENLICEWN